LDRAGAGHCPERVWYIATMNVVAEAAHYALGHRPADESAHEVNRLPFNSLPVLPPSPTLTALSCVCNSTCGCPYRGRWSVQTGNLLDFVCFFSWATEVGAEPVGQQFVATVGRDLVIGRIWQEFPTQRTRQTRMDTRRVGKRRYWTAGHAVHLPAQFTLAAAKR
jgi:hypothetical protein